MNLERTVFPWPGDPRIHIKEDFSLDIQELTNSSCRTHFKVPGAGSSTLNFRKVPYLGALRAFIYSSSMSDSSKEVISQAGEDFPCSQASHFFCLRPCAF